MQPKNYIAVVLDRSGSMQSIAGDVISAFNSAADVIRERSQTEAQDTRVSLFTFANRPKAVFEDAGAANLKPLTHGHYQPNGQTALYDAVGMAIERFQQMRDANADHVSFLLLALTDGAENNSFSYTAAQLRRLIAQVQATGRWTVTFQLPPGTRANFARTLGVPEANCREWEATARGTREAGCAVEQSLGNYFSSRSAGVKSVASFYVGTDLSKLTPTDVKRQLVDISSRYKALPVGAETAIREFVEDRTGQPYAIGTAFYQLTKPEMVQGGKSVLITEKGKTAVWGGPEARQLVGLPAGADAKVVPGNHANFDIFVQSTSTNRKLVRGTRLLVEKRAA